MVEAPTQIRYDLTRDEHAAAMRHVTRRLVAQSSRGWLPLTLTLAAAICGGVVGYAYLELAESHRGPLPWAWWGTAAFLAAWITVAGHQQLRLRKIHSASVADDGSILGPQEFTVTDEALVHRHRSAMTHIAWPALKSIEEKDGSILIFMDNAAFYVVSGKAFANADERATWIALLRSRSKLATVAPDAGAVPQAPPPGAVPAPASMPSPDAPASAIGLLRNFRSGIRLAFLQRVERQDLVATAEGLAVLVVLSIVVLFLLGVASVGSHGELNFYELPRALMEVPLMLLFGLIVARMNGDPKAILVLAVALTAAGIVIAIAAGALNLLAEHKIVAISERDWEYIHYLTHAWWAVAVAVTVLRLAPSDAQRRLRGVAAALVLLVLPTWLLPQGYLWVPRYDPVDPASGRHWALAEEKGFYAQHDALPRALARLQPERPGVPDLYVITAGLYSLEDVFMKEVKVIDVLFRERFDAEGRTLTLINNPKTVEEHPVASLTSLTAALRHVGKLMNPEEDVLVLYVSSHGAKTHNLAVEFWPVRFSTINPPALKKAVDESGIKWKVIVVSACYSGGFVEPLRDDHTLIITASAPTKISFGCGNDSDSTYLAKALFDEEMRKTYSFETAFSHARKSIEERERGQGFVPSEPQIFVGTAVRAKLAEIEQRLAARVAGSAK
jgi:hypothetical protein